MNVEQTNSEPLPASVLLGPAELREEIASMGEQLTNGCGNHGCRIKTPTGMATTASCLCVPQAFAERLLWLACELDKYGRKQWPKL